MDLYKYHITPKNLIGYDKQSLIPALVFDKVVKTDYWLGDTAAAEANRMIEANQSVLGKDPYVAYRVAKIYRDNTARFNRDRDPAQLWPRHGQVERNIASHPNAIASYTSDVLGIVAPEYFDQILKATPETLNEYLAHFSFKDLKKNYPEFVHKALVGISSDPEQAFHRAVSGGGRWERIPELEDAIYKWNPSREDWMEMVDENYKDLADIDWDEESPSAKIKDYPHFDSPWNLYLAQLHNLSARYQLIKERGFKGRVFR